VGKGRGVVVEREGSLFGRSARRARKGVPLQWPWSARCERGGRLREILSERGFAGAAELGCGPRAGM